LAAGDDEFFGGKSAVAQTEIGLTVDIHVGSLW
jgi:hypothetical protein